jgi:hypothetical protein
MLLVRQATERAPLLQTVAPHIPARLASAIDRCLVIQAHERWPTAESLAVELNAVRARSREMPGAVRAWVREVLPAGNDIGMGLGGVVVSLGVWVLLGMFDSSTGIALALDNIFVAFAMAMSASLFGGLALIRFGSVAIASRDLIESGYDHDIARLALVEADSEQVAEKREVPRGERRRRALAYGLIGAAKSALALWLATLDEPAWLYLPATVLSVLIPMITIRTVSNLLQEGPSLWSRLMRGRLGHLLFRGAKLFTRRRAERDLAANHPTIAAMGLEAEALFRALPPAVRDQLSDLPEIVAALRARAERLRAEEDRSDERVSGVVAAMESLRLELLEMGAGTSSVPNVTRNLEEARRIAERVDIVLRSRDAAAESRGTLPVDTPA